MKIPIVPVVLAGAATLAIMHVVSGHRRYRHKTHIPDHWLPRSPMPVSTMVDHHKHLCHSYIHHSCVDPHEAMSKDHIIEPLLHEHCHRMLPHMLMGGAHPEHVKQQCIGICEKVCAECNVQLKPRCMPFDPVFTPMSSAAMSGHLPRYHAHALQASGNYYLDYNHAPTPTMRGSIL